MRMPPRFLPPSGGRTPAGHLLHAGPEGTGNLASRRNMQASPSSGRSKRLSNTPIAEQMPNPGQVLCKKGNRPLGGWGANCPGHGGSPKTLSKK